MVPVCVVVVVGSFVVVSIVDVRLDEDGVIVVVIDFFGNVRARVTPRTIIMISRIVAITTERRRHHLRVLLLEERFLLCIGLLLILY